MKIEFLHLSDLHIKQNRFLEYEDFVKAAQQVYDYGIRNFIDKKGFIVITGDLTDRKRIGLEESYYLFKILTMFCNRFKVFIILGQHDGNWNNNFKYNNILYNRYLKNLHYL